MGMYANKAQAYRGKMKEEAEKKQKEYIEKKREADKHIYRHRHAPNVEENDKGENDGR